MDPKELGVKASRGGTRPPRPGPEARKAKALARPWGTDVPGEPGAEALIRIGGPVPLPFLDEPARIVADDPLLRRQVGRPWFRAYAADRLGGPFGPSGTGDPGNPFGPGGDGEAGSVPEAALARHCMVSGATGSGKSRLMELLLDRQLEAGLSAVVFDPKGEGALVDRLLARAQSLGIPAEAVTLFDFRRAAGIPGWDLLRSGVPLHQAASDIVSTFEAGSSTWGPRLQDVLTNALLFIGSFPGLSLYELVEFLRREEYRDALLRADVDPEDPAAYGEARSYFLHEFGAWSRSERVSAVGPVLNKLKETMRSPCLRPLLCARKPTFRLADLWRRQGLLLVKADPSAIGDEGVRLLMGFLAHGLLRAAQRSPGPVPVVLGLDELPLVERFLGKALVEILTTARSLRLRLLVGLQHLGGISPALREALAGNAAVQAFFRMGDADARWAGSALAAGSEPQVTRTFAEVAARDRKTGRPELAEWRHPLFGPDDRPVRAGGVLWRKHAKVERCRPGSALAHLRDSPALRLPRLYVRDPVTGEAVAAERYVAGLPPECYWVDGPELELVVAFPKPKLAGVERRSEAEAARRWAKRLQELPARHAVVRVDGRLVGEVRVQAVEDPPLTYAERERYTRACLWNGQSAKEVAKTFRKRKEAVERAVAEVGAAATGADGNGVGAPPKKPGAGKRAGKGKGAREVEGLAPSPLKAQSGGLAYGFVEAEE